MGARQFLSASMQIEEHTAQYLLFLSPLMQGTLTVTFTEWVRVRLIPADAGNTVLVDSGRSSDLAHKAPVQGAFSI